jgi:divalent metal cation (Fe/Co/Zn/Cd) transporter
LLSGIITALTSLQTISITSIRGALAAAPYLLLALGIAAAIAGGKLLGGHGRAAIAATALNGLLFFASGAWLVVSLLGGLFSLFALVDPGLALIAGAVAAASIAPCVRVTAARKVGEQAGFGLGI